MVNEEASVSKAVKNVFFDFLVFCLVSGLTVSSILFGLQFKYHS